MPIATTTYSFASNAQGFVSVTEPGVVAAFTSLQGNPAGCLSMRAEGDTLLTTNRWVLSPITWETLGVPPGATVVRAYASYQWRCLEYGLAVSGAGQVLLYTADLSALIAPISYSGGNITGVTPTWQTIPASGGSLWTIPAAYSASNRLMQLHIQNILATHYGETDPAVHLVIDNLEVNVEHSTVWVENGVIQSVSAVSGAFTVIVAPLILTVTGAITSASAVAGQFSVIRQVSGTVASVSAVNGAFVVDRVFSGVVASLSVVTGNAIMIEGGTIYTFTGAIDSVSSVAGDFLAPKVYVEAGTVATVSTVAGVFEVITGESFMVSSVSAVAGVWEVDAGFDGEIISASTVTGDAAVIEELGLYIEGGEIVSVSLVELLETYILAASGSVHSFSRVTGEFEAINSVQVYQDGDFRMGVMRRDKLSTMVN